ncbi:DUF4920 domain-containing protein [Flammeovirga sp. EKP202]|uniref:DUF4920 domain-containing protein n=1 Tax=Flammeovirga sp. EKP202 TaxID=2770592 RepID=UPI00166003D5|nr:DUF4920 domain-containing protein [Flammeovirga sp. EKP202]MBD0401627.1 DUF4920 domain-containing protein [Flammeovirga sp. EKP202]
MKLNKLLPLFTIFFISCQIGQNKDLAFYGDTFEIENVSPSTELKSKLDLNDTVNIQLEGEITGVCQTKGCWLTLPMDQDGAEVFVKFKDYKFFVPMDATGKKAVINGIAKKEIISVAELKHYAEDAGKSEEEIAKIKSPKTKYMFMAEGVAIEN